MLRAWRNEARETAFHERDVGCVNRVGQDQRQRTDPGYCKPRIIGTEFLPRQLTGFPPALMAYDEVAMAPVAFSGS